MPVLELTDEQAVALIQNLPEAQQQRIMASIAERKGSRKQPVFGSAKNDILFISEDFNAPLDEFKEHM